MTKHDALPSWRGLLFGVLALAAAALAAAWIISRGLERREGPPMSTGAAPVEAVARPPSPSPDPPPAPLAPPAAWQVAARIVGDAQAISALLLAFDGKWVEADRHARAMYELPARGDPKAARTSNEIGLAHFRAGRFADAARAFDSASRADPGDVEAANNLGYASLKAGRIRESVPQFLRTLRLAPLRSSAWINLSEALADLGCDDASVAALLIAVRHAGNRDEIRAFLVDATRAHASEPFGRQAKRALAQLDSVPAAPPFR